MDSEFVLPEETPEVVTPQADFSADFQLPEEFDLPQVPSVPEQEDFSSPAGDFVPPAVPEQTDFGFSDIPDAEPEVFSPAPEAEVFSPAPEAEVFSPAPEAEVFSPAENVLPEPEPYVEDALTEFNREWSKKIEEKRAAEFEFEKKARDEAREELASWNTQRDIRLKSKADSNRVEEQNTIETLTSEIDNIQTWDRVSRLIESSTEKKPKKKAVKPAAPTYDAYGNPVQPAAEPEEVIVKSDVSRMKNIFIQLKNEPLETTRREISA